MRYILELFLWIVKNGPVCSVGYTNSFWVCCSELYLQLHQHSLQDSRFEFILRIMNVLKSLATVTWHAIGCDGVGWIHLDHDKNWWLALGKLQWVLSSHKRQRIYWPGERLSRSDEGLCFMDLKAPSFWDILGVVLKVFKSFCKHCSCYLQGEYLMGNERVKFFIWLGGNFLSLFRDTGLLHLFAPLLFLNNNRSFHFI
jgi:hypothetical protein